MNGFVFFGSANSLLERIRKRVEAGAPRFLLVDLRRVTGVDSSAVVSFVKVVHLAEAAGFELVFTGASGRVRKQLERGGVAEAEGVVRFEPDLDRGLQWCEDRLLRVEGRDVRSRRGAVEEGPAEVGAGQVSPDGRATRSPVCRPACGPYLERVELPDGAVLIRQDEPPDDVFVIGVGPAQRGDGDGRAGSGCACGR